MTRVGLHKMWYAKCDRRKFKELTVHLQRYFSVMCTVLVQGSRQTSNLCISVSVYSIASIGYHV